MVGPGPLINVGPIVAGGVAGPVGGALITERVRDALVRATAVCILFVGLAGALEQMLRVDGAKLASGAPRGSSRRFPGAPS
ncbi:MAG: DUF554 family protein [Coriobacteriaceae bacterium]|nr:DUF554 family protein [Coriobacteriaceae bacterium]